MRSGGRRLVVQVQGNSRQGYFQPLAAAIRVRSPVIVRISSTQLIGSTSSA